MILPNSEQLSPTRAHTPTGPRSAPRAPHAPELVALVARAQAEDPQAQTELVRHYTRRLAGFVRGIVRDSAAVDDIVQTVFIKMFRRLVRLRDVSAFESWLFMLARNTALDFLRRQRRRPVTVSGDETLQEIADTRSADATGEILDALDAALAKLHPKTRALIALYVQGWNYSTLAMREGLTLGAVKARLHRARPLLRACVGKATSTRLPD